MAYNFKNCDWDQLFLFPPDIRDWLLQDHLVRFITEIVSRLDLSPFYSRYNPEGDGRPAYHPAMMTALYFYSCCSGERSSRRIERLCIESVPYRVVSGGLQPDHTTISRFRKKFASGLSALFLQIITLCRKVINGRVRIDLETIQGFPDKKTCIVDTAQGNDAVEHVGMPEKEICRVISPHAASGREETAPTAGMMTHKGNEFFNNITVVIVVALSPVRRGFPGIEPCLPVDAVHGVEPDDPPFKKGGACFNHPEILIFVKSSSRRGKNYNRFPVMAVDLTLHIPPDPWAEKLMILNIHRQHPVLCSLGYIGRGMLKRL
jgi:transposase